MTLIQLHYVLSVAEYRNFTIAAEKSFVTQPTLSMQIQKLEKELQVEIFDRSTHPISITHIGKKIIDQAKAILQESENMYKMVSEQKNNLAGDLVMGIIPTILPSILPLFYKNLRKKFPELQLTIKELKTDEILTGLKNGDLDFGIAATPLSDDQIIEKPIYYEPLVGFIHTNHVLYKEKTLRAETLPLDDMLLLEEGHCFRNNVLSICNRHELKKRKFTLESGSFDTLVKLVNDGFGFTLLPLLFAEDLKEVDKQKVRNFEKPVPTREISLLYHQSQIRLSFVKEFSDLIQGIIRGILFLESEHVTLPKLLLQK